MSETVTNDNALVTPEDLENERRSVELHLLRPIRSADDIYKVQAKAYAMRCSRVP